MSRGSRRPPGEGKLLQLVYVGYVVGSALARMIPERVAYALAEIFGRAAARWSKKRAVVARNLARITGEPPASRRVRRLVEAAYVSYARYWLETFRLVREGRDFFLERFRVYGEHHLDEVLERGKGAIIVVGHLGNWDAAGAWVGATGRRLVTVAEVLRPKRMFDFFVAHRARLGMTIHPAEKGVTGRLTEAVEAGAVVAILGDRDLKGRGIEVDFFGAPATFPRGPAAIARATGVPLLVAGVFSSRRVDGHRGWDAVIKGPIDPPRPDESDGLERATREMVSLLEEFVAMQPEEWHVFQPFWRDDREPVS